MKIEIETTSDDPAAMVSLVQAVAQEIQSGAWQGESVVVEGELTIWTMVWAMHETRALLDGEDAEVELEADRILAHQELEDFESGGVPFVWTSEWEVL